MARSIRKFCAAAVAAAALLASPASAKLRRRGNLAPVMGGQNFPDPGVIRTGDGWHAFSTNGIVNNQKVHVQMAYTPDFKTWTFRGTKDAMLKLAPWVHAAAPKIWAPDVTQLPDGSFIMYYCASLASKPATHCLGYATSKNVEGPYVDTSSSPWICPQSQGGAIDPAGFLDAGLNERYVVYKVDGNSIGHGGECGNTVKPIVPTPLILQQVNVDNGRDLIGSPIQILTNGPADGPYVEAPSLTYLSGKYVLFFSSQCYATPNYDVSYAISDKITGPYTKNGPLFVTGTLGLTAPGGMDVAINGDHAVFHANSGSGRAMFTAVLSLSGTKDDLPGAGTSTRAPNGAQGARVIEQAPWAIADEVPGAKVQGQ
ncbi:hypothetical protein LTR95_009570 [Oleoguttula sp. CCFEE 5521]